MGGMGASSYSDGCRLLAEWLNLWCLVAMSVESAGKGRTYGFHHGWQLIHGKKDVRESSHAQFIGRTAQGRRLTQDLLHLHDARVGANVVDGLSLLGLVDVLVVEDIVECQRLLRKTGSHFRLCVGVFLRF
jgi:hypothetical protein